MKRKNSVVVVAVALIALGGCDTQPATHVSATQATLNSKGKCERDGYSGHVQYQLRNASAGGSFFDVGPRHSFNCAAATGEVEMPSSRIGGLTEKTTYQFRLVSRLSNGQVNTWDAAGTSGGTNYDSFRTASHTDWSIVCQQHPGAVGCEGAGETIEASNEPATTTECEDGTTACSSASQKKCKGRNGNPLTNKFTHHDALGLPIYRGSVNTDWCWKNGKIVERHSVGDASVSDWGHALLYYVNEGDTKFMYSACAADMSSCLTRYTTKHACCLEVNPGRISFQHCIGTRICAYACGDGGAFHSRNIIHGACPE